MKVANVFNKTIILLENEQEVYAAKLHCLQVSSNCLVLEQGVYNIPALLKRLKETADFCSSDVSRSTSCVTLYDADMHLIDEITHEPNETAMDVANAYISENPDGHYRVTANDGTYSIFY